jgi:hypothetical protein
MTQFEIEHLFTRLRRLFPKHTWTEDLFALAAKRCVRLDLSTAQIDAVVEEYRVQCRDRSPRLPDLLKRLKAAVATLPQRNTPLTYAEVANIRPPVTAWNHELAARYDANPEDPVFARLKAQGISVFVATRGMRGSASGKHEVETAAP